MDGLTWTAYALISALLIMIHHELKQIASVLKEMRKELFERLVTNR